MPRSRRSTRTRTITRTVLKPSLSKESQNLMMAWHLKTRPRISSALTWHLKMRRSSGNQTPNESTSTYALCKRKTQHKAWWKKKISSTKIQGDNPTKKKRDGISPMKNQLPKWWEVKEGRRGWHQQNKPDTLNRTQLGGWEENVYYESMTIAR